MKHRHRLGIGIVFLWMGFVCAISFMEAWLKFQAPGVTTELGLGIGRLVFNALNKVEISFGIALGVVMIFPKKIIEKRGIALFLWLPILLVGIQTFWLLPELDLRANLRIQGKILPDSRLHLWYVLIEVIKVSCLLVFGINLLRNTDIKSPKKINDF